MRGSGDQNSHLSRYKLKASRISRRMSPASRICALLVFALLCVNPPAPQAAENLLAGPIALEQARVIDGDTLEVVALIWLNQRMTTRVRVRGIDTPERKGACPAERAAAETARTLAAAWLEQNRPLVLRDLSHDKYGGRVVGRVQSADGRADLADMLVERGLARPYGGGRKNPWC